MKALLPPFEKAVSAIWSVGFDSPNSSDAAFEFKTLIEMALADQPPKLQPDDLLVLTSGLEKWTKYDDLHRLPEGAYAVRCDMNFIREFAISLRVALTRIEAEIRGLAEPGSTSPGFSATEKLILNLTDWAEKYDFLVAPYVDGTQPAPFARFVCSFLELVPKLFRERRKLNSRRASSADQARSSKAQKAKRERRQQRFFLLLISGVYRAVSLGSLCPQKRRGVQRGTTRENRRNHSRSCCFDRHVTLGHLPGNKRETSNASQERQTYTCLGRRS